MRFITHMNDYNISGPINAIMKMIQKLDKISRWGTRAIYISRNKTLLEGFNLNKIKIFDTVLRCGLQYDINRELAKATVYLPDIWAHLHLYNPDNHALYRIVVCLGVFSDYEFSEVEGGYTPINVKNNVVYTSVKSTDWQPTKGLNTNNVLELELDNKLILTDNDTLVLSIGIEFGQPLTNQLIQPIKYSGSAKILALV